MRGAILLHYSDISEVKIMESLSDYINFQETLITNRNKTIDSLKKSVTKKAVSSYDKLINFLRLKPKNKRL
jgi:hypothetical protein